MVEMYETNYEKMIIIKVSIRDQVESMNIACVSDGNESVVK